MVLKGKIIITVFALLSFLLSFCTVLAVEEGDPVDIPLPVKFQPALNSDGSARYIQGDEIERQMRKVSPNLDKFYYNKKIKKFIIPEGSWMLQFLSAYGNLLDYSGVKAKTDTWDCENFSGLLNSLMTVRIWNAGFLDTRAAVGWLRVDAKKSWAGIPGNYLHALIFVVTAKGIFIVEPQNGEYVVLQDYPNKEHIQEVFLF